MYISLEEACDILSISVATAKNWIRLGKLQMEDNKKFRKSDIENILNEIKNGKDNRLKSRRNKKNVVGKSLYKNYIHNEYNQKIVEQVLNSCGHMTEEKLRIILAHFAIKLFEQSTKNTFNNVHNIDNSYQYSSNHVFNSLIKDLIGNINPYCIDVSDIKFIFDYKLQFIRTEDTLGFVYISLCDLNRRKQLGTYYTPKKNVDLLIDSLMNYMDINNKTICDPCCGTGNFLIGLLNRGIDVNNIYGQDIDEISVLLARINIFLLNNKLTKKQLTTHFVCGDTLKNTFKQQFSIVLGNPPWGYNFTKDEIPYLSDTYVLAKKKGIESYELFIEKGISLLKPNGFMAYILPEVLLNVASHLPAREYIIEKTSFKFISYLGNTFSGVQSPAILLGLYADGKGNTENCKVSIDNRSFTIKRNRTINPSVLTFNMSDNDYECINTIESVKNAHYLKNNAKFAIGIVTGNNKKYIKNKQENGYETILKGEDIFRYSIQKSDNFIKFTPEAFQQVASSEIYRANEKILYRFISEVPVFAYDNHQTLSLNSCNVLIPQIEGMDMKYILGILNSSVTSYFITKKFNSVKLLRSHIEALPIPMVDKDIQKSIIKQVDNLIEFKSDIKGRYRELDNMIMNIYGLKSKHKKIINTALKNKNLFFLTK